MGIKEYLKRRKLRKLFKSIARKEAMIRKLRIWIKEDKKELEKLLENETNTL